MRLLWIALCLSVCTGARAAVVSESEKVRVKLFTLQQQLQVSGQGLQVQNQSQIYQRVAIPQGSALKIRIVAKNGKNIWAVQSPGSDIEKIFTDKYLLIQGQNLRIGSHSLPTRVLLSLRGAQKIEVIGILPLEEYIVGVLASEMPLTWPAETLKAQAIAARSYALAVIQERASQAYHLESNILDQVFRHVLNSDDHDPLIKNALEAVNATKGIRLVNSRGRVVKAFFHSDCGGKTTAAKNVWGAGVDVGVAVDASCPSRPKAQWSLKLSAAELQEKLKVSAIEQIDLINIAKENRVRDIQIVLNHGLRKTISVNEFRQKLGFSELRSSVFNIHKEGEFYIFRGQGSGHGVGLCQWGSRALGKSGQNYAQILKHYYPLAELR